MSGSAPNFHVPQDDDRRDLHRNTGKAFVTLYRDSDVMRNGIPGTLKDISAAGIGLELDQTLEHGEQLKIRLQNIVQRFDREVRGLVRHVDELPEGRYLVGIELYTRLLPRDVQMLKVLIDNDGPTWI